VKLGLVFPHGAPFSVLFAAFVAPTALLVVCACGASADQKRAVLEMKAEELSCIDNAKTKYGDTAEGLSASRACRAEVRGKYAPIFQDSGVSP
jgi:hypothetical protein